MDTSDVIRDGQGGGALYVYGYRCAPDRLKIGSTELDTVQRIAAQITTSTFGKPVLLIEIKTHVCRAFIQDLLRLASKHARLHADRRDCTLLLLPLCAGAVRTRMKPDQSALR